MRVEGIVREMQWEADPDAYPYLTPCRGCHGYCMINDVEPDLADVYGDDARCAGVSHVRQRVVWNVRVKLVHDSVYVEVAGQSHASSEEAELNAMAAAAAYCIRADRRDD